MQIIPSGTLSAPNCCFLCEQSPQGGDVIDTGYAFYPQGVTPLDGSKYVCSDCLKQMADLYGYEHSTRVAEAKQAVADLQHTISMIREQLANAGIVLNDFRLSIPPSFVDHNPVRKATGGRAKSSA